MLLECFEGDPGVDAVYQRLLDQVKNGHGTLSVHTVVMMLEQINSLKPDPESAGMEEKKETGPELKGNLLNT